MTHLTIRGLDDDVVRLLELSASRQGRSLEEQVRHVLTIAAQSAHQELLATIDGIRNMTPSGRRADSVALLRQDRRR